MIFILLLIFISCADETAEPLSNAMKREVAFLPQNANMIGYINFEQIKHSSFYELVMDSSRRDPFHSEEYLKFLEITGFDFEKDISELYFAACLDSGEDNLQGLFVAHGRFDEERLINYLRDHDKKNELVEEVYLSHTIYHLDKEQMTFSFFDSTTVVGGDRRHITTWLDSYNSTIQNEQHPLLQNIKNLKYKNGIWFTMTAEPLIRRMKRNEIGEKIQGLKNIKQGGFAFDFSDQLNLYANCECTDSEKAGLLKDAIAGFIATAKLSRSDERDAVDILNKIDVQHKGKFVTVKFKMTKEEFEKLIEKKKTIAGKYKRKTGLL